MVIFRCKVWKACISDHSFLEDFYHNIFVIVLCSKCSLHLMYIKIHFIIYVFRMFIATQNLILMEGRKGIFNFIYMYICIYIYIYIYIYTHLYAHTCSSLFLTVRAYDYWHCQFLSHYLSLLTVGANSIFPWSLCAVM